jgi:hypothetical protein
MMNTRASFLALVLFAAALAAVAGCAAKRDGTLTGRVSYQGKPVLHGTILVQCADGTRLATNIKSDGSYSIEGLMVGLVKIGVNSPEPPDAAAHAAAMAQAARAAGPAGAPANLPPVDKSKWFKIPDELGDPESSGKSATVTSGTNQFDIQLP